jgi:hypothetical protein
MFSEGTRRKTFYPRLRFSLHPLLFFGEPAPGKRLIALGQWAFARTAFAKLFSGLGVGGTLNSFMENGSRAS